MVSSDQRLTSPQVLQSLTQQLLTERSEKKEFMEMLEQEGKELQSVIAVKDQLEVRLQALLQKVSLCCAPVMPICRVHQGMSWRVPVLMHDISFRNACVPLHFLSILGWPSPGQRAGECQAGPGAFKAGPRGPSAEPA